jgi:hypothetical protein
MADDPDRLVARAIESVLDQVPGTVDTSVPDSGTAKLQPWAETAAPVGRNKRPLEELLVELEAQVAADPQARATLPRARHPALAFFDRFGRTPAQPSTAGEGASRRRRRRRGGDGGGAQTNQPVEVDTAAADRPKGGRRRSRRGRGGGEGAPPGVAGPAGAGPPRQEGSAAGQKRAPGSGGRRRRGRRGRGGDRPTTA